MSKKPTSGEQFNKYIQSANEKGKEIIESAAEKAENAIEGLKRFREQYFPLPSEYLKPREKQKIIDQIKNDSELYHYAYEAAKAAMPLPESTEEAGLLATGADEAIGIHRHLKRNYEDAWDKMAEEILEKAAFGDPKREEKLEMIENQDIIRRTQRYEILGRILGGDNKALQNQRKELWEERHKPEEKKDEGKIERLKEDIEDERQNLREHARGWIEQSDADDIKEFLQNPPEDLIEEKKDSFEEKLRKEIPDVNPNKNVSELNLDDSTIQALHNADIKMNNIGSIQTQDDLFDFISRRGIDGLEEISGINADAKTEIENALTVEEQIDVDKHIVPIRRLTGSLDREIRDKLAEEGVTEVYQILHHIKENGLDNWRSLAANIEPGEGDEIIDALAEKGIIRSPEQFEADLRSKLERLADQWFWAHHLDKKYINEEGIEDIEAKYRAKPPEGIIKNKKDFLERVDVNLKPKHSATYQELKKRVLAEAGAEVEKAKQKNRIHKERAEMFEKFKEEEIAEIKNEQGEVIMEGTWDEIADWRIEIEQERAKRWSEKLHDFFFWLPDTFADKAYITSSRIEKLETSKEDIEHEEGDYIDIEDKYKGVPGLVTGVYESKEPKEGNEPEEGVERNINIVYSLYGDEYIYLRKMWEDAHEEQDVREALKNLVNVIPISKEEWVNDLLQVEDSEIKTLQNGHPVSDSTVEDLKEHIRNGYADIADPQYKEGRGEVGKGLEQTLEDRFESLGIEIPSSDIEKRINMIAGNIIETLKDWKVSQEDESDDSQEQDKEGQEDQKQQTDFPYDKAA